MGTIRRGANGGFSGKAGSVIGSSWNGIDYIKGLYKKRTKPATEEQKVHQARFQLMALFLYPFKVILRLGYGTLGKSSQQSAVNVALKENLEHAIIGEYPFQEVDYEKVRLSRGNLVKLGAKRMQESEGVIMVNWDARFSRLSGNKDDEVILVFYHPGDDFYFMPEEILTRSMREAVVEVPERLTEGVIHGWSFAMDRDLSDSSKTEYLGSVILSRG